MVSIHGSPVDRRAGGRRGRTRERVSDPTLRNPNGLQRVRGRTDGLEERWAKEGAQDEAQLVGARLQRTNRLAHLPNGAAAAATRECACVRVAAVHVAVGWVWPEHGRDTTVGGRSAG